MLIFKLMKRLFIFICLATVCLQTYANLKAYHFCNNTLPAPVVKLIQTENLSYLNQLNVIVSANNTLANYACFVSDVKQIKQHVAFNTNTVLVKLKPNTKINVAKAFPHPLIPNLYTIKANIKTEAALTQYINELSALNNVVSAQANQVFTLQVTTNDQHYNRQWAIENTGSSVQGSGVVNADMNVDSAWQITTGNTSIKVGVLDSGVDTLHEDLVNNLLPGFDGFKTDSTDTKGFPTPNFNRDGHGTACAGIIAAEQSNGIGISGVSPNCKLVPVRVFFYQNYGGGIGVQPTTTTNALISGLAYAWRIANVDVVSISAGLADVFIFALGIDVTLANAEINEAFFQARNGKGLTMFFSAGNDDTNDVLWPADLPNTIAVGASTMCDERKNPSDCSTENWGSSYGLMLDVVAPGTLIATTDMQGNNGYTNGQYTYTFNGTSAACPNAAGVGALILSVNPNLRAADVKAIINQTANKVGGYAYDSIATNGRWNVEMGYGRVNAYNACKLAQTFEPTVSIRTQNERKPQFKLFPNPSNGKVTLINMASTEGVVNIYNAFGKLVLSKKMNANQHLPLNLLAGVYIVKLGKQTQKLVVY